MKNLNKPACQCMEHILNAHNNTASCDMHTYAVSQPFSEKDIINLQDLFLKNGWHCLNVKDLHTGRSIIATLLYSLNYYHDVACLSTEDISLDSAFIDIYAQLIDEAFVDGQYYDIESFLLDNFFADFLWIEETDALLKTDWYEHFLVALADLKIHKHMPIILLSYT